MVDPSSSSLPLASSLFTHVTYFINSSKARSLVRDNTTGCLHVLTQRKLYEDLRKNVLTFYQSRLPSLHHKHLTRYDDLYTENGHLFTVTEYFTDGALGGAAAKLRLDTSTYDGIVDAVKELHKLGIVHGAIRATNLYVGLGGRLVLGPINEVYSLELYGTAAATDAMAGDVKDLALLLDATKMAPTTTDTHRPEALQRQQDAAHSTDFTISPASHVTGMEDHEDLDAVLERIGLGCADDARQNTHPESSPFVTPQRGANRSLSPSSHHPINSCRPRPADDDCDESTPPSTMASPCFDATAAPHTLNPFMYRGDGANGNEAEYALYVQQGKELRRAREWEESLRCGRCEVPPGDREVLLGAAPPPKQAAPASSRRTQKTEQDNKCCAVM
eukprot:PhM_4_TR19125/c0_g1_i1/m.66315